MENDANAKNWFLTLPGILSGLAAVIVAITGLIKLLESPVVPTESTPNKENQNVAKDECISPYVWRLAVPSDHVCVFEDSRKIVELENQRASERRNANGGAYGPDTCLTGFVWREAFKGDTYCVLPTRRDEVREENARSIERIKR